MGRDIDIDGKFKLRYVSNFKPHVWQKGHVTWRCNDAWGLIITPMRSNTSFYEVLGKHAVSCPSLIHTRMQRQCLTRSNHLYSTCFTPSSASRWLLLGTLFPVYFQDSMSISNLTPRGWPLWLWWRGVVGSVYSKNGELNAYVSTSLCLVPDTNISPPPSRWAIQRATSLTS